MLPLQHAAALRASAFGLLAGGIAVLVTLWFVVPFWPAPLSHLPLTFFRLAFLATIVVAIPRSRPDFEFVQLVPFRIGTITLRNGEQLANPTTHLDWLHIIHLNIMNHSATPVQ